MLIIMLFDFESKESAECFVGIISKNEDCFTYKGNTVFFFINIDMHVQNWTGTGDSRSRRRHPEFETIVT